MAMDAAGRAVLEKLVLAHEIAEASWDGEKYRVYAEDPVYYLLGEADRQTLLWAMYHHLMGRSDRFMAWAETELGIAADNRIEVLAALWQRHATPRILRFVEANRDRNRLPGWRLPEVSAGQAEPARQASDSGPVLYDRLSAAEQQVIRRLWTLDEEVGSAEAEKWRRLFAALSPEASATPLARWLSHQSEALSWAEHVAGFLSAVFAIRNRPWFAEEYPPAYVAAYERERAAVRARLQVESP